MEEKREWTVYESSLGVRTTSGPPIGSNQRITLVPVTERDRYREALEAIEEITRSYRDRQDDATECYKLARAALDRETEG